MIAILVADHKRAQLYSAERLSDRPTNVASLVNPSASVTEFELTGSTGGRTLNKASGGYQAYDSGDDARQSGLHLYIRDIAALLDKTASDPNCGQVAIVAQPRLLADIKRACATHTLGRVSIEVPKDLTHESLPTLMGRLKKAARKED